MKIVEGYFIFKDRVAVLVVGETISLEGVPDKVTLVVLEGDNKLAAVVENTVSFGGEVYKVFYVFNL